MTTNRQSNQANNKSKTVDAKFLKRDVSVGLFLLEDGRKIRIHQIDIDNSVVLSELEKGTKFLIPKSMLTDDRLVSTKRKIARKCGESETSSKGKDKRYETEYICEIANDEDAKWYHVPVGTEYYWLNYCEFPLLGDIVLVSDWDSDVHSLVKVSSISTRNDQVFGKVLSVNGVDTTKNNRYSWHDLSSLSFVVLNPEHIDYVKEYLTA
jgi:hypothetical protein